MALSQTLYVTAASIAEPVPRARKRRSVNQPKNATCKNRDAPNRPDMIGEDPYGVATSSPHAHSRTTWPRNRKRCYPKAPMITESSTVPTAMDPAFHALETWIQGRRKSPRKGKHEAPKRALLTGVGNQPHIVGVSLPPQITEGTPKSPSKTLQALDDLRTYFITVLRAIKCQEDKRATQNRLGTGQMAIPRRKSWSRCPPHLNTVDGSPEAPATRELASSPVMKEG
ncbi:hypothetical protein RF11_11808 [Thelohanellus kitauei]|uniref:Uncharacterized protein n=1 Tax=Thelohanellus kitauei TaxID=669202 RepID=A0A0C2JUI6_THEKT|nr:hypothetical protein RF11_11808 [Thelohanellus kitauei]